MSDSPERAGHPLAGFGAWQGGDRPGATVPLPYRRPRRHWAWRLARWALLMLFIGAVAGTAASFGYNQSTDGPVPRPSGLLMARGGGFDTRYREWGTSGTPIVLVPGAFETADTFAALGPVLAAGHRVFAIDLTGTGYSTPSPPYNASHLAGQLLAFLAAKGLTGTDAPVLIGHSSGAAVVGVAAVVGGSRFARGVVFLDGDATPLGGPGFLGWLLVNPYRTTLLRLALRQNWLIKRLYDSQCGPTCPPLSDAGVQTWRLPLQQPGFSSEVVYTLRHGIPAMANGEFGRLHALAVPKLVIYGTDDPQMSAADAVTTASRIGAPAPVAIPGRHLTMISSPHQLAAALRPLLTPLSPHAASATPARPAARPPVLPRFQGKSADVTRYRHPSSVRAGAP